VEDLGTQLIEGLTVRGNRTTKTWSPEGKAIDPDNLMVMTTWSSEQLQITILSELNNGKRGGSQHKNVNIVRVEPDQSQFKIPPGYKLFDSRERRDGTQDREKGATETNLPQDLTWTDPSTRLMWTKLDNGMNINWEQATKYCRDMRVKGFSDWRLPTIDELRSIHDPTQNVGGYQIKGGIRLGMCCTWSSTQRESGQAWILHFMSGGRVYGPLDSAFRALCVRKPQR